MEKQFIPQLRFREFSSKWESDLLNDLSTITTGSSNRQDSNLQGEYTFFDRSQDIRTSDIYLFEGEAIIVAGEGSDFVPKYYVGKFDLHQRTYAIMGFKDSIGKFLYYYIHHHRNYFFRQSVGSTVRSLRLPMFQKMNIIKPSIKEQTKIANFLTAIDHRIQTLEKKKSLLEQYKKGVMRKIFKQELKFKDDNGNDFPEWKFKNGNLLFKSISDKNHNSDLPILAVTQDQGAIPRHLINYNVGVSVKSVSSYKVVQVGDFIISLRSFQGGIEYSNYKGICSPAYIILKPTNELDKTFYKYYLKTPSYIQELTRKLEGIRDGKMISYKYFSEIKLPYPSIEEQTKIANFLSAIDKKIELVNKKVEQTKSYKKGLLQQMFI